jgi:hypothetical protein
MVRVKRFIPSEFGSNTNIPDVASIEYLQPKVKLARFIEEKAKEGLIEYTLIATGPTPSKLHLPLFLRPPSLNTPSNSWCRRLPRIRHQNRILRPRLRKANLQLHRLGQRTLHLHLPPRRRKIRRRNPQTRRPNPQRRNLRLLIRHRLPLHHGHSRTRHGQKGECGA